MHDELRSATRGPANRLGVTPTFVADHDPERERSRAEHATLARGNVDAFFGRIDLHLVLEASDGSIRVDHDDARMESSIDDALRSDDARDVCARACLRELFPRALEEPDIGRRRLRAFCAIARNETLGEG